MSLTSGDQAAVLITGCSSGLGQACALDLAGRGIRVFAGVRKSEDAERLRRASEGRIEPLEFDVSDEASVRSAYAALDEAVGRRGLDGLVNNAGVLVPGPWELLSTDSVRRQFEVNVVGTHCVTRTMLPLIRRAGGRIVLMGSISGRVAPPFCGAYAASKHALEAMADSLRMELRDWKIAVSIVEPDSVGTVIWDKFEREIASLMRKRPNADSPAQCESGPAVDEPLYREPLMRIRAASGRIRRSALPVSAVVRAVNHALLARRPRTRYAVGWRARLAVWASARLPSPVMDWFLLRSMGL
jgi:NAD(P)-dependent dehydrogenase (short-subunit alcohol dehydrogenase family)